MESLREKTIKALALHKEIFEKESGSDDRSLSSYTTLDCGVTAYFSSKEDPEEFACIIYAGIDVNSCRGDHLLKY